MDAGHETTRVGERGPLAIWRDLVAAGSLVGDPEQQRAAARLDRLWAELAGYRPAPTPPKRGLLGRLRGASHAPERPRGVYLVGDVGRGKSMLMDLFFDAAPVGAKRRIHFHRFMQDAHARVHALKRAQPGISDPIPPLADAIAADATLLCFDEFQVNDIADALILGRLFEALFARGVVVVATSNTPPGRLFQDRPGADAFKPFIAILQRELDTVELASERDYRRRRDLFGATWFVPADRRADDALDEAFALLTAGETPHSAALTVHGRKVVVPLAAAGVARFDFDALCGTPLGAGDYLEIARCYATVMVDHVPRLGPENFDVARRFIVLVDALYEAKVKLVASADATPDSIYEQGEGAKAFERTASRLAEMQSRDYQALPHAP
jgi:cell division protein ZapE